MDEVSSLGSASRGGSTTSNGTKRKRGSDVKFYAVRVGHKPGVYSTWADCLEQVKGFKKAMFKSFPTLGDAERFVAGENPQNGGSASSPSLRFYAVKSGRIPGIYTDWESASEQITGWQKPKHRCFTTRAEAQRFLNGEATRAEDSPETPVAEINGFSTSNDAEESLDVKVQQPPAMKKSKKAANGTSKAQPSVIEYNETDFEPGMGPLPSGAEDGFDPNIILDPDTGELRYKTRAERQAMKAAPGAVSQTGPIRIHTDGSSLGNGTAGAFAGVGVYFGPGDRRNISETLPGPKQTNQRAELTAIQRALDIVPMNRNVAIVTDSKYSIDCLTNWFVNWRRNGWKNAAGKAVENKDLIESILAKIEEREGLRVRTNFEWIKGHSNDEGNKQADKLAVDGARKAAVASP